MCKTTTTIFIQATTTNARQRLENDTLAANSTDC